MTRCGALKLGCLALRSEISLDKLARISLKSVNPHSIPRTLNSLGDHISINDLCTSVHLSLRSLADLRVLSLLQRRHSALISMKRDSVC